MSNLLIPAQIDPGPPTCECCQGSGKLRAGVRLRTCGVCAGDGLYRENVYSVEMGLRISYYNKETHQHLETKNW